MAFIDSVSKLADKITGATLSKSYQLAIAKMFRNSMSIAMFLTLAAALFGKTGVELHLCLLVTFSSAYAMFSWYWLQTDEGKQVIDHRLATENEAQVFIAKWYGLFTLIIMAGVFGTLLTPALVLQNTLGVAVSDFLIIASPAIVFWRNRKEIK